MGVSSCTWFLNEKAQEGKQEEQNLRSTHTKILAQKEVQPHGLSISTKIEFNFDSSLPHTFSWEDLVQITRTFHHLPISDEFKSALELFSMSAG